MVQVVSKSGSADTVQMDNDQTNTVKAKKETTTKW